MRGVFATLTLLGAIVGQTTIAGADCRCRGSDGTFFQQGELACIRTAKGPRLARCEMVLNNSSWTVVRDDCPEASASRAPLLPAGEPADASLRVAAGAPGPHADLH